MDLKLKQDIEDVVTKIFSAKEEADQKKATQKALNASAEVIDDLTKSLESKTGEMATTVSSLKDEIVEKDSKIVTLSSEIAAAKKELEEATKLLAATKESLDNIKKDQIAEVRMSELKESKVVMANDIKGQSAKVREMSDSEFAAYKVERVELRDAVMRELKEAQEIESQKQAAAVDAAAVTTVVTTETPRTAPAQILPGQAIAAALNFETKPSDSMIERYADLGRAMASSITSDKLNK